MSSLRVDRPADGVLRVALDRPRRRNAIDDKLLAALQDVLHTPDEPVAVLTSTDPRAFCAGGDLSLPPEALDEVSDGLHALYASLVELPTVIIAAVEGAAVGAGAQLLLASDLRIAGARTQISFAGARSGLAVGTWGLPGLIGWGRALDLSLSGRTVGAEEAATMGLVDEVVAEPTRRAVSLAAELAAAPAAVPARIKRLVRESAGLVAGIQRERAANAASHHIDAGTR